MAQQAPDEPPDSIILQNWAGVRNTVTRERLGLTDLEAAVNVDLDDAGQPRRRRGITLAADGDFHSVRTLTRGTLGVKDGALGWIDPDASFRQLVDGVGSRRVAYVPVVGDIYFSSEQVSGVIRADDTVDPWGVSNDAGQWVSPIVNPTATMGAVGGRILSAPPLATELEYYNGRIYAAQGPTLWATELYLYHLVERTRNFKQFEADITLVMAVNDGLYVGTAKGLSFLKGDKLSNLALTPVSSAAVIPGSGVFVPTDRVHPQARQGPVPAGVAAVFLTAEGWCAAFDGGQVFNLTRDRMVFPEGRRAAALYREQDGVTQTLAVLDSGGSPTSTARIGDYLDAEIIRAADRGL